MDAQAMILAALVSHPPRAIIALLIGLTAGVAIGAAHYFLLWRNVERLTSDGSVSQALAPHLGRFLVTGAALYFVARLGALPLAAALLGIIGARIVIGRRIGAAP
jgi:hypothetical protein